MHQPKERKYIDVDGLERHIILVREPNPLFQTSWHIKLGYSPVSIWNLEGSIIQIPDAVWVDHGYNGKKWKAPVWVQP